MNSWCVRVIRAARASKKEMMNQIRDGADYPKAAVTRDVETCWFVDSRAGRDVIRGDPSTERPR